MLKKLALLYFAIISINSFGMTTTGTKLKGMAIQSIVFTYKKKPIAEINAIIGKVFSPIIKQSLEYKTTDSNNNTLYWDLSNLKPISIRAFIDLLKLQHIKTMPQTQTELQALQALKNNGGKPEFANITEQMQNIIRKSNIFFDLLTLIDYFQVESLARIAAEQLPKLFAQHIQEANIQDLNIDLIPPLIQKNACLAFADNLHYPGIILPQNVQQLNTNHNVTSVAFSPNSKLLAYDDYNTVKLLDLTTNTITTPITHNRWITSIAFSPDGKFLASCSDDNTMHLLDIATNNVSTSITHNAQVLSIAFSPDSKFLASRSVDNTVKLLNLTTNTITTPITHNRYTTSIAFSPDGKFLASCSYGDTVKLLDISTNTVSRPITHNRLSMLVFSPDGKFLAAGSNDGIVKLLNLTTNTVTTPILHDDRRINCIAFSPDSRFLACNWEDGTVKLLDISTNTVSIPFEYEWILTIAFSPDAKLLAAGSGDRTVKLLNLTTNTVTIPVRHDRRVESIAFSSDNRFLASKTDDDIKIAHLGITGLPFDQALAIAILEELKITNSVIKIPENNFIHKIIKKMSPGLQKFVNEHYNS